MARCPVEPDMRALLDSAGADWSWRPKRRHWQLIVGGRAVLTSPYVGQRDDRRRWQNALACVRRALRSPL